MPLDFRLSGVISEAGGTKDGERTQFRLPLQREFKIHNVIVNRKGFFMNNMDKMPLHNDTFSCSAIHDACTTILVGNLATADGSCIIARTGDQDPCLCKILLTHPAHNNQQHEFTASENGFTYPIVKKAFTYTSFPNGVPGKSTDEMSWGEAGFNEQGVGMTATETIFASARALKNDPYLPDTGITEESVVGVILPYIKTAKQGVARLGKIIEEKGAGEGFGVAFIDAHDIWYLETGSGHQWMAARIPAECYFVTGNQGRLRKYDPADNDNYLGSQTLINYAIENGLYQPNNGSEFNFEDAYTQHIAADTFYNYPRVYALQHLYSKEIKTQLKKPQEFAVFEKPTKKLTIDDVKNGLRNTYENINIKPYTPLPDYTLRPISLFRTTQSHILQSRVNLPPAIANITYFSYGMPAISLYIPFYSDCLKDFPQEYKIVTTGEADSVSAQWKFRKLQTLVMVDYYHYAPIVQQAYADTEKQFSVQQYNLEQEYQHLLETSPEQALKRVEQFHNEVFRQALRVTDMLTNQIFTLLTRDFNRRYKFAL